MSAIDLFAFRFALASCGCIAAGLGVWALTMLGPRLADVSSQRPTWLLSQLTNAAAFRVILLPTVNACGWYRRSSSPLQWRNHPCQTTLPCRQQVMPQPPLHTRTQTAAPC